MFYEVNRTTSLGDDTFVSSATMRAHVRAIDNSEDDLLRIYRNAAVDYLQSLSDRVLGLSTAKVLLDYNEFRAPFRIQKLQGITSVDKLEYMSNGVYTMYEPTLEDDGDSVNDITVSVANDSVALTGTRHFSAASSQSVYDITLTRGVGFNGTLYRYNFHKKEYETVGTMSDQIPTSYSATIQDQPPGLYKYVSSLYSTDNELHFTVNNGTLFKYWAQTEHYPANFDFQNLFEEVKDCDDKVEHFARLSVSCGTALNALPMQYTQAALLLIGHYYNMREAEAIGGVTAEVKEGVHRLIASVRQY